MVGDPRADAALFVLFLFVSFLVSAFEAAIQSVSRHQLEERLDASAAGAAAALALRLKAKAERLRATANVVTTFSLVLIAIVSAPYVWRISDSIAHQFYRDANWLNNVLSAFFVVVLAAGIAAVYLIFVVLIARNIGRNHSESLGVRSAGFMNLMMQLLSIPTRLIIWTGNLLLKPSGRDARFIDNVMSEEGLMDILEEGTKTGILDKTEHELIESIFAFTETTAREIMVPRTEIIAIEKGMLPDEILQMVVEEGFTRMPVYEHSIDNIVGVIYAKDVLSLVSHRDLIILADIIRPAFYVPETKSISELLRDFQRKRQHLAVVVDEFGGTEGIITMEDILEEIVGEIQDEYDEEERFIERSENGGIVVMAKLNIAEFNAMSDFTIPESEDYDTIGGFVTGLFGRIPDVGDEITFNNLVITTLQVEDRRIVSVGITPVPGTHLPPADTD